jgi:pantetheine-phosphate adenylyltransferase
MKKAIYPGTFDPITHGHMDVIRRASALFDEVIVAISASEAKNPLFSLKQREEMARCALADLPGVRVVCFGGLLVAFARQEGVKFIVRGLRAVSDFEYELQMGYANESLDPAIETIYLMPSLQYAFISSSVVRAILTHGGGAGHLVPEAVEAYIKETDVSRA